jgi:hypothetical protein
MNTQTLTTELNSTFANPLPTLKSGEIKTSQRWVSITKELIETGSCRPVISSGGSWKYSSLYDETFTITNWLKSNSIDFEVSNDAPKGGKTGAKISLK